MMTSNEPHIALQLQEMRPGLQSTVGPEYEDGKGWECLSVDFSSSDRVLPPEDSGGTFMPNH